ncbi:hypothetical protein KHS38_02805 [Mucilaginibacter sp. Bleaf8]|uniref:hypothetical protein n=1 Tax=Mucilaginibacter sp. Bleaf8 TaxID=2834430 RepID=UPI001BCD2983|nr:hypothetical protein [Mucilaginibacter sp. Bleaf8]MBS7563322.1 hypothetical protein [Mucilaginibacter sp. Bleaf8]
MATLKTIAPATWTVEDHADTYNNINLWNKFTQFADSQKNNRTLWFFINLLVHGVFFLPVPAALMYYFDAPIVVLAITMGCFFTNLIANMGGAGIRSTLLFFFASIAIHVLMVLIAVL